MILLPTTYPMKPPPSAKLITGHPLAPNAGCWTMSENSGLKILDSSFHKNIVAITDRAGKVSNIDMARLLGLPKKQIDLIQGTANMMNAFDFKVAGDHTDIKALMKNFPNYKKNFTRIEYIKDNLNEFKRSYDRKILSLSKQAKGASPSVQQNLLEQQQVLQNEFAVIIFEI